MDCYTDYLPGRLQPFTVWCGGEVVKFTRTGLEAAQAHRGAHTGTDQRETRIGEKRGRREAVAGAGR